MPQAAYDTIADELAASVAASWNDPASVFGVVTRCLIAITGPVAGLDWAGAARSAIGAGDRGTVA